MVEHRRLRRDDRRMLDREAEDSGAELDLLGLLQQRGEEDERRGDRLRRRRDVFADPALPKAQLVGQDHRLAVLLQDFRIIAAGVVNRLHEEAELHGAAPWTVVASHSTPGRKGTPKGRQGTAGPL